MKQISNAQRSYDNMEPVDYGDDCEDTEEVEVDTEREEMVSRLFKSLTKGRV